MTCLGPHLSGPRDTGGGEILQILPTRHRFSKSVQGVAQGVTMANQTETRLESLGIQVRVGAVVGFVTWPNVCL